MTKYTPKELDLIARHINGFVRQDDDGNVVWHNNPDAEAGWRLITTERCREALGSQNDRSETSYPENPDLDWY